MSFLLITKSVIFFSFAVSYEVYRLVLYKRHSVDNLKPSVLLLSDNTIALIIVCDVTLSDLVKVCFM